ncbi:MAG: M20/M25/M40 family metallo-hydrolase, partial [Gemmatimonadetes bacterium]|nr:M20/M25/M40 family metallo-hydrolase [Gemmatimonadota bacterium]
MPGDPVELARELVRIESPTGEEGAVGEFLARHLEAKGYDVQRQQVTPGRFNVFATTEPPVVVLSTHMDTVPPSLPVREDDTYLYGRGSADAKGIIAAQVAAAERLATHGERRVALLFVVGEELTADGARAAATLEPKGRYLINGEPTDNRMARGHKGMLRLELRARGRAAHSAYPEEGESAIEPVLDALERVRRLPLPDDPELGGCTLNIGTIAGGTRPNVIPDACRAELLFRTVGANGELLAAVRTAAGERVEVVVAHDAPPVRLRVLPGFEPTLVRFGTDVPWLEAWG